MNIVQCTTGCQLMRSCHAWHAILSLMSATVLNHHHCHHFRLMILVFLMPRENSPYNMCLTYLRLFIAKLYYYVPLRGGNKYKEKSLESVNKIRLTALIKTRQTPYKTVSKIFQIHDRQFRFVWTIFTPQHGVLRGRAHIT